jgi:hypothetical protein
MPIMLVADATIKIKLRPAAQVSRNSQKKGRTNGGLFSLYGGETASSRKEPFQDQTTF